jgi:hypothetical protein
MKLKFIFGALFLALSINVSAQQPKDDSKTKTAATTTTNGYVRPDRKKRQKDFIKSVFGPLTLARQVAGAGFSTWRNSPEEWGGKWEGFGRRVASNFGRNAIRQTTVYALDESFKLDSKFYRSQNRSFGAKVKNALISPFTARTASGKRVFGFPRVVGTYTASVIAAETWFPPRFNYKNGLRSGTISLGLNAAFNLFKEFIKK